MNLFIIVIIWRILLFGLTYIVQIFYKFAPMFPYSDIYFLPSNLPQWIWSFANFDGVHYLTIAKHGYFAQYTQAFFPLYPLCVRFVGLLLNDNNFIISGLFFSFFCFIIALFFYQKLLLLDYSLKIARKSIFALLVFPTSFYFVALYSESLFFLLVVLVFYFARKKKWWLSCVFAMFASATRVSGIFLLPCLIIEFISQNNNIYNFKDLRKNFIKIFYLIIKSKFFYLVPLGLLGYMYYLKSAYNDALYFWHAQPAFGAERSAGLILPPQVIWRYIKILFTIAPFSFTFWYAFWEFFSFIFGLLTIYYGYQKKIRLSYLLFSMFIILVPSFTGTFSSMPRYLLLAFPIYLIIGMVKNKYIFSIYLLFSILLLVIFTLNFSQGLWVA